LKVIKNLLGNVKKHQGILYAENKTKYIQISISQHTHTHTQRKDEKEKKRLEGNIPKC
jgi:hypothetical protein